MQTLSEIRALLAERGLRPNKRFGQHFLHDKNQLRRLVDAAGIGAGDLVLEVGPGTGTLTEALLEREAEVVACEIDDGLAAIVADRYADRVRLVRADCLEGRALGHGIAEQLAGRPFTLVANLPYQVAGTLIGVLLVDHPECRGQYVTIQKEVAERLLATPGTKQYGTLGVTVQVLGEIRRIGNVAPSCFWPIPKVDSVMCAIRPRRDHGVEAPGELARFIQRLFATRRKKLRRILGPDFTGWPDGVTGDLRPETLTPPQIVELWRQSR